MLFHSFTFIFLYLPIVLCLYYLCAGSGRAKPALLVLTLASLYFYADWNVRYLPLLIGSIAFNFLMGKAVARRRRKSVLAVGVGVNLALLGYFKYMGFFTEILNQLLQWNIPQPHIVLPLGISFFTFTQTAYLIDIYRRETDGCGLLPYSLFVTVFPHLIAGPILHHRSIIPQFGTPRSLIWNDKNVALGVTMFSIGLFKKVGVADTLAPFVNMAFAHTDQLSFLEAWLGALGYTFQLYFDFSGYSEMALGLGLMFNLKLPLNFNSPYRASSIIDFWRRWHMTLGFFLRNYLYIPLGGNRCGRFRHIANLLATMLLGGLWHGAGWTFIIWGGLHGLYLAVNHLWRQSGLSLPKHAGQALTFLCVTAAWVFFRAETLTDAMQLLRAMTDISRIVLPSGGFFETHLHFLANWGIDFAPSVAAGFAKECAVVAICLWAVFQLRNTQERLQSFRPNWKWLLAAALLFSFGVTRLNQLSEFLYFQF